MTVHLRDQLGRFGIWRGAVQVTAELAARVDQLGFGALWLGGSPDGDLAPGPGAGADAVMLPRHQPEATWPATSG